MKSKTSIVAWIVAVVVIVIIIILAVLYVRHGKQQPVGTPPAASSAAPASSRAVIRHPIGQAQSSPAAASSTPPLPPLDESDRDVIGALTRLGGGAPVHKLLVQQHVIPRIVATINALPQHEIGNNILPLKPPAGSLATRGSGDEITLAPADYKRYAPYMTWIRDADVDQLVDWYVHAYPLFQQAYRQLGYPHGYFNDRLVQVIDHLLQAPVPTGSISLVKTDKGYDFADPQLEGLSAGQKMMVRVGPDNEKLIKKKLRAIRAAVTGEHGPAPAASSSSRPPM